MDKSAANSSPSAHPLAVVTGASSGIGLELAREAATRGYDLIIAADESLEAVRGQLEELVALVAAASSCAATQPAALRARLEQQLAELAGLVPAMPQERLAQEVALLATRADIREELDRLRAHLAQAGDLLRQGEAVGRQLDFLCQELNREANTLCSKSADIELTRIGLALKAAIEQFREQVQNLE